MSIENLQGGVEPAADDSVAGAVLSAWDEVEGKDEGVASAPPEPQVQEQAFVRDEFGRFVAKESQPAGQGQQIAPVAPEQGAAGASPQFQPPHGWSPTAKAEFAKLPPAVQEAVAQREQEINQGFQQYSGLKPWVEHAQQNGTTLPAVLNDYYNAHQKLATDFIGGIGELCRYFGHDPIQLAQYALAQAQGYQGQPPGPDPTIQYLQQLSQQVQGLYRQQEEQQSAAINSQLEEFAADHEWFHNLEPMMADIVNSHRAQGREISLQEAYDAAAWQHPETRQILLDYYLSGQGSSTGRPQTPAPSSNRGRSLQPGSPIPGVSNKRAAKESVLDELNAAWDELSGL
jgi:hypothetical protein